VIRPLKSPEFGSSLAVGKTGTRLSTGNDLEKKWRRGWDSNLFAARVYKCESKFESLVLGGLHRIDFDCSVSIAPNLRLPSTWPLGSTEVVDRTGRLKFLSALREMQSANETPTNKH